MIVRLQRDFLNTLRQQQQAEDDEYSDDEVCALNFTKPSHLSDSVPRAMTLFLRFDVLPLKVHSRVYWAQSTTGEADLLWRQNDYSMRCTIVVKWRMSTINTIRGPL